MDIDNVDRKLLQALDINPKATLRQVAKYARITKETAQYRVKMLKSKGIITKHRVLVNYRKLGLNKNILLIKYKELDNELEREIISFLEADMCVTWLSTCEGSYNLTMTVTYSNIDEFTDFYRKFFAKFGKYFLERVLLQLVEDHIFNSKMIFLGKPIIQETVLQPRTTYDTFDDIDKSLILTLSEDSDSSYSALCVKFDLTPEAIRKRVSRLFEKGVFVGYYSGIQLWKLGFETFEIWVSVSDLSKIASMLRYYIGHKDCSYLTFYTGKYDLALEFQVKSTKELRLILLDLRSKFGAIISDYCFLNVTKEYIFTGVRNL